MATMPSSLYEPFSLSVQHEGKTVVVLPVGELDLSTVETFEREVRGLYTSGTEQVVVDLSGVGFLDSTGLRVLLTLRNEAKRRHRGLTLVPGPRGVQRIFELTATRGLFDWRDS